jgi:L-fuconolactonase
MRVNINQFDSPQNPSTKSRAPKAKATEIDLHPSTAHECRFNRKQFLATAAQMVAGVTLMGTSSSVLAALGQPVTDEGGFAIIDTHTHFYDPTRAEGVPWPPRDDKLLYRQVLPKDYRAVPVPRPVLGTVVVETSPWLEDNQWVLDLAAHDPFIVGFVGNVPVGTKGFGGHLKRFAANPLFRGLRLRNRKPEGALDDPAFVADLKLLAVHDRSLDLLGGMEILPFADRLAKEVPSLRIIINHLAGVVVDGQAPPADWVTQMRALVRRPNIYCKLSGLVEGTGRSDGSAPRNVEFYRRVLDAMCSMFSPERLMYASNWPVSARFAPLATVQGIIQDYFRSHGHRAEELVFSRSAKAAYKWVQREKTHD